MVSLVNPIVWFLIAAEITDRSANVGVGPLRAFSVVAVSDEGEGGGGVWERLQLSPGGQQAAITNLVFAPSNPDVLYGVSQHGVWQSLDGAQTWRRAGLMTRQGVEGLFVDAADPMRVYVHNLYGRTLRGDGGGRRWQALELPEGGRLLGADPVRPDVVYAGSEHGLFMAADGGMSWTQLTGEGSQLILVHPREPRYMYSGTLQWWDMAGQQAQPGRLSRSADGGLTWEYLLLDRVFDSLQADPGDGRGLYGISGRDLWHSVDNGSQWVLLGSPPGASPWAWSIHPHPSVPGLVFAWKVSSGSVSRSRDGGVTWEGISLPSSLPEQWMGGTIPFVDPTDPDRLFLLGLSWSRYSMVQSQDGGESWQEVRLPQKDSPAGTVLFGEGGQVYVGSGRREDDAGGFAGIYVSDDGGTTWTWRTEPGTGPSMRPLFSALTPAIATLFRDSEAPGLMLAHVPAASVRLPGTSFGYGSPGQFLRSADNGRSWDRILDTIAVSISMGYYTSPTMLFRSGVHWIAGEMAGIRVSRDGATSWEPWHGPLSWRAGVLSLAMDPVELQVLYAARHDGLWVSRDFGQEWQATDPPFEDPPVVHLAFHPLDGKTLYAATRSALYVSRDRAATWSAVLTLSPRAGSPLRLRFHPQDKNAMYLVAGESLLATRDGGASWASVADQLAPAPWINDVAVDPFDPESLYAATPWGVYRTDVRKISTVTTGDEPGLPQRFAIGQNFPNPFNLGTVIPFVLDREGHVQLTIYDLLGQRVRTLLQGRLGAGAHTVLWDGQGHDGQPLASGVYLCRLQSGPRLAMRKLLLLK